MDKYVDHNKLRYIVYTLLRDELMASTRLPGQLIRSESIPTSAGVISAYAPIKTANAMFNIFAAYTNVG
jgi:hypothetical protein